MALQSRNQGFTLVEMAIVVAIIALLIGTLVLGTDLAVRHELTRTVKDIKSYATAYQLFKDKYTSRPGDIPNGFTYFPTGCGTNANVNSVNAGCNGNGDRQISEKEGYRVWNQLALDKLIPGTYPGSALPANGTTYSGGWVVNFPLNSRNGTKAAALIQYYDFSATIGTRKGNVINIGRDNAASTGLPDAALTGAAAYEIDRKMDDGKPFEGDLYGRAGTLASGTCTTTAAPYDYQATGTNKTCSLYYYGLE
jgi:prepilin-type N-terminal cleavage/methylation domain-containing protein